MESLNILIAVHYQIVRDGLKKLLESEPDFSIQGLAKNPQEVLNLSFLEKCVLILDYEMPELEIKTTVKKIIETNPEAHVLVIGESLESTRIRKIMQAGASGFLLKEKSAEELIKAVREIWAGEKYLCDDAFGSIINEEKTQGKIEPQDADLTERELEVLDWICHELTNREIAGKLGISVRTVDAHRRNLLQKTGVKNTAGLVKFAIKHRLFTLS